MQEMPAEVQDAFGFALYQVQLGETPIDAKPLRGFGGTSVMEVVDDYAGDTYRAVYTACFAEVVYVLHVFQKKSKRGIETPKPDMDLIRKRFAEAKADYARRYRTKGGDANGNSD